MTTDRTPPTGSGPVGIGVIGAGRIAGTYLENMTAMPDLKVLAVGDRDRAAATARADAYGVATHGGVEAVLDHADIEIVVNLTNPLAHADVDLAAIAAGKHVYSEKPLSHDLQSARQVMAAADRAGRRVACAPDTVLGPGIQTALRMIRRGDIGTPLSALVLQQSAGPDRGHPHPAPFFDTGGGPLFDMGPYYLTTLVLALGSATRVSAAGSRARERRSARQGPQQGEEFPVTVLTNISSLTWFAGGASAQAVYSFDSPRRRAGVIELTGTEGMLAVPNPNRFDGEVRICGRDGDDWEVAATTTAAATRGTGVLDLARAIRADQPHRASAELGYHTLDLMAATSRAAETGEPVSITSECPSVAPVPTAWDPYELTLPA